MTNLLLSWWWPWVMRSITIFCDGNKRHSYDYDHMHFDCRYIWHYHTISANTINIVISLLLFGLGLMFSLCLYVCVMYCEPVMLRIASCRLLWINICVCTGVCIYNKEGQSERERESERESKRERERGSERERERERKEEEDPLPLSLHHRSICFSWPTGWHSLGYWSPGLLVSHVSKACIQVVSLS